MNALRRRRELVSRRDLRVVEESVQQPPDVVVSERRHHRAQLVPHRFRILQRSRKEIAEIDFAVRHPAQLVNGELRPVVVELHQPFDLDEVVALERLDNLGHVVPHLAVDFARAVRQNQRQVWLARALLPHFFRVNQKYRGRNFVRLQFPDERRLHCGVTGVGVAGTGVTVGGAAGLVSFALPTWPYGITFRNFLCP